MTLLLLIGALAANPVSTTTATSAPAAQAAPVKEKKICKIDPAYTGTRMKKRICLTESEWEQKNNSGKSEGDLRVLGGQ